VDKHGQAFVTGLTESFSDFPTKNALQSKKLGPEDAFVAQITADGAELGYSTYLGGNSHTVGKSIAVDEQGQAYVTGYTESPFFPMIRNALQPTFGGESDAFVAQFAADGRTLRYLTYLGGSGEDHGSGITVDQQGQAYVTGYTNSADFPTEFALEPALQSTLSGSLDAFVAKIGNDESAVNLKRKVLLR
jgi:hypothetical protein